MSNLSGVRAIETHYAGCRFRSRLEARWAVFFNHLGIAWEYEPEGLSVSYRLSMRGGNPLTGDRGRFAYLPDFWLPDLQVWAEVKATLTDAELLNLLDAAASLSSNDGGGCHDAGGNDLIVLGKIPATRLDKPPTRLHMHKGDLMASFYDFTPQRCWSHGDEVCLATDVGGDLASITHHPIETIKAVLLDGAPGDWNPRLSRAYTAARKARFEHGKNG